MLDQGLVRRLGIDREAIELVVEAELCELERREAAYRDERDPPRLEGKTVILVDDGLATGASMRAAALAVREQNPARVVVAVPVAAARTCDEFRGDVDDIVCMHTPEPLTRLVCGTRTSPRRATRRCAGCSRVRPKSARRDDAERGGNRTFWAV